MSEPTGNVIRRRVFATVVLGLGLCFEFLLAFPVDVAQAPRNDLYLTLRTIQNARKSLLVNIYEMKSPDVADALIDRIRNGVHVEVLMEGQPVGGMSEDGIEARRRVVAAMKKARGTPHFYMMETETHKFRRFHFNHAKYIVVDDEALMLGSENYSAKLDTSDGKPGNRGWQVFLQRRDLAQTYKKMFYADADPNRDDISDLVEDGRGRSIPYFGFHEAFAFHDLDAPTRPLVIPDGQIPRLEATAVESVVSPDTSLMGLKTFIGRAKKSLRLQLMAFSPKWGNTGRPSPLYEAVVAAARRGVKVRVLLNDERVFAQGHESRPQNPKFSSKYKHPILVKLFNDLAEEEGLDLEAKIADLKSMKVRYIHNKGGIVDDDRVLISSINWNQNSVENNREAALVLEGNEINRFYTQNFDSDWGE